MLQMQILTLTLERKLELEKLYKFKSEELSKLKKTTIQQLWTADLDRLEAAVREIYAKDEAQEDGRAAGVKRKRKASGDDDDDEMDAVELVKRPAASSKSLKLWKGAKKGKGKKGGKRRGKKGQRLRG